jgi:hypothetical protein
VYVDLNQEDQTKTIVLCRPPSGSYASCDGRAIRRIRVDYLSLKATRNPHETGLKTWEHLGLSIRDAASQRGSKGSL